MSSQFDEGGAREVEGKDDRRKYCEGLEEGHENYERCQAWLSETEGRRCT